ncbi:MAG: hypothetical protein KAY65_14405, partial [Planctomycetes bacterium]|nr:hypothetical protein [Planctomycetota bacterium]
MCKRMICFISFVLVVGAVVQSAYAGEAGVMMWKYNDIGNGTAIVDLTGSAKYPDSPDEKTVLPAFDTGQSVGGNNYGTWIYGYVIPSVSDSYTFWLTTDDPGSLRLNSTGTDPAGAVEICRVPDAGYSGYNEWDKFPNIGEQVSAPVYLIAGTKYYIETLHKEAGGGDHVRVAWQTPTMARTVITSANLETLPIMDARYPGPADDAKDVGLTATLTWTPGDSATSHDVYFGEFDPPIYQVTQAGTTYDPGSLSYGTDYYWRIIESDGVSTWIGPIWHFKTMPDPALAVDPNLIGWWKFDGDYLDWSGYNNHGSPYGSGIGTVSDPERGQVLSFNGTDDYVGTGQSLLSDVPEFTLAGWVSAGNAGAGRIGLFGQNDAVEFGFQGGDIHCWTAGGGQARTAWTEDALTWHHIAVVGDGTTLTVYVDGEPVISGGGATASYGSSAYPLNIGGGGVWDASGNWFSGQIDDVRLYDKALTPVEIKDISIPMIAWDPTPADGSAVPPKLSGANLCMVLKYEPGKGAVSHTGYFSENYDDVLDRVAGANLGEPPYLEYDMNDYYVGYDDPANIPAFARVSLERGKTYYWAVDEFDGTLTFSGKVWSFTVMPEEAWGPDPFDGAKYVIGDPGATLSWNMGDVDTDGKSVTYEVYYGTDETAVETSTTPDVNVEDPTSTYTTETLLKDTVYYWRVDTKLALSGPPFTFQSRVKGNVWSFTTL